MSCWPSHIHTRGAAESQLAIVIAGAIEGVLPHISRLIHRLIGDDRHFVNAESVQCFWRFVQNVFEQPKLVLRQGRMLPHRITRLCLIRVRVIAQPALSCNLTRCHHRREHSGCAGGQVQALFQTLLLSHVELGIPVTVSRSSQIGTRKF